MSGGSQQNLSEARIGQCSPRPLLPKFPNQRQPAPNFYLGSLLARSQNPEPLSPPPPQSSVVQGQFSASIGGSRPPPDSPPLRGLSLEEYMAGDQGTGWQPGLEAVPVQGPPAEAGGGQGLWPWDWQLPVDVTVPTPQGTWASSCLTWRSCSCSLQVWGRGRPLCGVRPRWSRALLASLSPSWPLGGLSPGSRGGLGAGLQGVRTLPPRTQNRDLYEGLGAALKASSSPEHPSGARVRGQGGHDLPPHSPATLEGQYSRWGGGQKSWTTCLSFPQPPTCFECRETGWYFSFAGGWGQENVLRPWHSRL